MKSQKIIWLVVALLAVALIAYGVRKGGKKPGEKVLPQKTAEVTPGEAPTGPIKIGGVLPLSGSAAQYGQPIQNAVELARAEINAAGGVAGQPLEVVWEDGKCDGTAGASAAQKLVSVDKVKIIFGGACSGETIPQAPITEPAKVLLVSPCASSPKISGIGDFVFRTMPSDALAGQVAAGYAYKIKGWKKAALITEQTDYAQGLRGAFKETFVRLGGEVTADEVYQSGATDIRTQILKIKESKPEIVYMAPQTGDAGLLILRQLKEGAVALPKLTAEVLMDRDMASKQKALLDGVIGVEAALDESNAQVKNFLSKYEAAHGTLSGIPICGANGYAQTYLLKEAIEKVGFDTEKIRDFFYALRDWDGPAGTLTFDKNGDPITGFFGVREILNGEVATLGTQWIMNGELEPFEPKK